MADFRSHAGDGYCYAVLGGDWGWVVKAHSSIENAALACNIIRDIALSQFMRGMLTGALVIVEMALLAVVFWG